MQLNVLYKDVSCTLPGTAPVPDTVAAAAEFIAIEHRHGGITPVPSTTLEDLSYAVTGTLKLRREPLVCVRQGDGDTFWVRLADLAANAVCMNINRAPDAFTHRAAITHLQPARPPPQGLLVVDAPEPTKLVVGYAIGPVYDVWRGALPPPRLLLVSGAAGAGKSALVQRLAESLGRDRLVFPAVTCTAARPWAAADATEFVVSEAAFNTLEGRGLFAYCAEKPHRGGVLRWGVLTTDITDAAKGRPGAFAVVEEHPAGAVAARAAVPDCLIMHVDVPDADMMDQRLRMSSKQYEEQEVCALPWARAAVLPIAHQCAVAAAWSVWRLRSSDGEILFLL